MCEISYCAACGDDSTEDEDGPRCECAACYETLCRLCFDEPFCPECGAKREAGK